MSRLIIQRQKSKIELTLKGHDMKKIIFIISLFLLIGMGPSLPGNTADGISPLNSDNIIKSKAPDFTLKDQNGKTVKISSLKGKKILLSFRPLAWTPV